MNIILLGAPGSGKGTQASFLSKTTSLKAISTGEILRKESTKQTPVGNLLRSYMDSGNLVPDDLVIEVIKSMIKGGCDEGFVFDGFPRNVAQAKKLDEMLSLIDKKIDLVINFEVNDENLIKRIIGRFSCKKCGSVYNRFFRMPSIQNICDNCFGDSFESRSDDNEETIINRLKVYNEATKPLVDYYKNNNLLLSINGLKDHSLISEELMKAIYSLSKKY